MPLDLHRGNQGLAELAPPCVHPDIATRCPYHSLITGRRHESPVTYGLGLGVGRPLGVGIDLGVGVGLGVPVGVAVGVAVGVGVGVAVGVGVGVGSCPLGNTRT